MNKHTPGPWTHKADMRFSHHTKEHYLAGWNIYHGSIEIVGCEGIRDGTEDAANARLIAAAPELLDALKGVLTAHGEQLHDAFDAAWKAIAKAEGEPT